MSSARRHSRIDRSSEPWQQVRSPPPIPPGGRPPHVEARVGTPSTPPTPTERPFTHNRPIYHSSWHHPTLPFVHECSSFCTLHVASLIVGRHNPDVAAATDDDETDDDDLKPCQL